jgi:hypothetical protein
VLVIGVGGAVGGEGAFGFVGFVGLDCFDVFVQVDCLFLVFSFEHRSIIKRAIGLGDYLKLGAK